MTDAANRTTGGTSVPLAFKGQKWKRKNIDLCDAPSARKKANFFKRDRLFIITCVNTAKKSEYENGVEILVDS